MSEAMETIDRETNIKESIDATGKRWKIFTDRQTGLAFTRPEPDRKDAIIPTLLEGRFTKIPLLQNALDRYLKLSWDEADAQRLKNARSNPVAPAVEESAVVVASQPEPLTIEKQPTNEELIQMAVDAENAAIVDAAASPELVDVAAAADAIIQGK